MNNWKNAQTRNFYTNISINVLEIVLARILKGRRLLFETDNWKYS